MQEHVTSHELAWHTVVDTVHTPEGSVKVPLPFLVLCDGVRSSCAAEISWSRSHLNVCILTTGTRKPAYVSDFRLSAEKHEGSQRFKIVHREVLKQWSIADNTKTLANETMHIIHDVARKLHMQYMYPGTIYINSSRPSLIQFFRKQGYMPESAEAQEVFTQYMREYTSRPRKDFLEIDKDAGSRFLLVHESQRKDPVLVDKHHHAYDPSLFSVNERLVWISRLPTTKAFVRMPFVVRCGFTKHIEI